LNFSAHGRPFGVASAAAKPCPRAKTGCHSDRHAASPELQRFELLATIAKSAQADHHAVIGSKVGFIGILLL